LTRRQRADEVEKRRETEGGDVAAIKVIERFWVWGGRLEGEIRKRANWS
jgi:hypothetical protein